MLLRRRVNARWAASLSRGLHITMPSSSKACRSRFFLLSANLDRISSPFKDEPPILAFEVAKPTGNARYEGAVPPAQNLLENFRKMEFASVELRVGGNDVTERRRTPRREKCCDRRRTLLRRSDRNQISGIEVLEVIQLVEKLAATFRVSEEFDEPSSLRRSNERVDERLLVIHRHYKTLVRLKPDTT